MLDKRKLHYRLGRLHRLRMWQLLIVLLFGMLVAATLLRLNNIGMIERRDAVIKADASGDVQATKKALIELQRYVSGHMNTSLGNGVYLSKTYERDRAAALQAATSGSNPNSSVYQQASVECQSRFQGGVESFRNDYVQCVIERVNALGSGQDPASGINLPRADSYRYDFASPRWSLDLAGLAVLFCAIVLLAIVTKILTAVILRQLLKHRFKSVL